MLNLRCCVLSLAIVSTSFGQSEIAPPATRQASTRPAFEAGLVQEIYALPRRPRRVRDVLPGLPPKVVRVVPTPTIQGAADLENLTGNVQAEFAGELSIPVAGDYVFTADSDDGMELYVDGKFVLADAWVNGRKEPSVATATLEPGWRAVRVRYYQGDGGFRLNVRWKPPGRTEFEAIPPANFRASPDLLAAARAKLTPAASDDPSTAHRAVFQSKGFFELPEDEGDLLVELLEGPTLYSHAARKDMATTRAQTNYDGLPYWQQLKVLAGTLRGWPWGSVDRGPVTARAAYTLSDAEAVTYDGWNRAKRDGFRTTATVEGREFTIYTPAVDSPERDNVARGIASLPASLRVLLRTVKVEPYGTASEFNGGGDTIWVRRQNVTPAGMIENTFSHEIGHLLMNKTDCYLPWQKAARADVLSVSHYARENPSEDFAEFTRLYLSTEGDTAQLASLRKLFPARFAVMDDVLRQVEFAWIGKKEGG